MNCQKIIILFLLTLGACKHQDKSVISVCNNFNLPVIVQAPTKDTIEFKKSDFLNECWFSFYCKHKFTDTLYIDKHLKEDTTYRSDFILNYSRPYNNDTLTTDGFQIFVDYKSTIYNKEVYLPKGEYYFPVYVVNETSRTKVFIGKDNYVFGLQEASDTKNYDLWRPIESRGFDFCGNGYYGLKIHPGEFVMFLVPKYAGKEKGLMRIRLLIGESIYLSQSFVGTFNRKQFNIKKDSWAYERLKEDKSLAIQRLFYGSIPKGYDFYR